LAVFDLDFKPIAKRYSCSTSVIFTTISTENGEILAKRNQEYFGTRRIKVIIIS